MYFVEALVPLQKLSESLTSLSTCCTFRRGFFYIMALGMNDAVDSADYQGCPVQHPTGIGQQICAAMPSAPS